MRAERGEGCVNSPVRPVGAPPSRYRDGLIAASSLNVRRMVVEFNCLEILVLSSDMSDICGPDVYA